MTKRCSICRKLKPEGQFYRQSKTKKWLRSECKTCSKQATARYYERNRARILEAARRRYQLKQKPPPGTP
ncbi:MAG TPA: hypothetical protein VMW16_05030 [Sedimentisphaerales bacterium]|nr:hypothetical protein [Sedimentisphaerales bacterium]